MWALFRGGPSLSRSERDEVGVVFLSVPIGGFTSLLFLLAVLVAFVVEGLSSFTPLRVFVVIGVAGRFVLMRMAV